MRLLVTGCGRSGTGWLAACLRAAGVDCGHERAYAVDAIQGVGWAAESSWLAAPLTPMPGTYVVHLVRHPLAVVRSNAERGVFGPPEPGAYGQWALRWCPEIAAGDTRVARAAIYWNGWNRLVAADETLRVEDVTAAAVARLARIVDADAGLDRLPAPANVQNPKLRGPDLTWDDVPDLDRGLAAAYGYRC